MFHTYVHARTATWHPLNASTVPTHNAAGASVPSFNAYPLAAVTTVGEYLMALPQQLEVLMGGTGGAGEGGKQQQQVEEEEGDELAAEWLDKVGVGHEARRCRGQAE
jgi:hypothetical protein